MKYQDFSCYWKIISSSSAVKILFLSCTCEDIGVAMVTNMISKLQESFPLGRAAGSFWNFFPKMASRCEDGTVTGDFLDELPNFGDRHIFAIGDHFNWTILLFPNEF